MDKISLLRQRKRQIMDVGKGIREDISALIDKDSFVELSTFSFSESEFYGESAQGEGVVTGFATIADYPFYIVAQNPEVLSGGVSKANCEKIEKCLAQAEKSSTPVIWLLSTLGVRLGEGVDVLEGIASLILKASQLKGSVPQYLVADGEVYGQLSVLAGICDFNFFIDKKSVLASASPLVISAHANKNLPKSDVGGAKALSNANITTFTVENIGEIKDIITKITELISLAVLDCDDLNFANEENSDILSVFDAGSVVELGGSYSPEIKCCLGRVGGIAVAAAVFADGDGVELNALNVRKIKDFAEFASFYNLPYVTFVNAKGIKADPGVNNSLIYKEIGEYVSILDCIDAAKISVIYRKAIGFGYTLFAAKSMGYDYSYAYADAKIALFDSVQGAEIEYSEDKKADMKKLAERYAEENSDPVNAAKGGYIDNIIDPAHVKQYLIASLQMLLK